MKKPPKAKPKAKKKPRTREERLIIAGDPQAALDRLLGKKPR